MASAARVARPTVVFATCISASVRSSPTAGRRAASRSSTSANAEPVSSRPRQQRKERDHSVSSDRLRAARHRLLHHPDRQVGNQVARVCAACGHVDHLHVNGMCGIAHCYCKAFVPAGLVAPPSRLHSPARVDRLAQANRLARLSVTRSRRYADRCRNVDGACTTVVSAGPGRRDDRAAALRRVAHLAVERSRVGSRAVAELVASVRREVAARAAVMEREPTARGDDGSRARVPAVVTGEQPSRSMTADARRHKVGVVERRGLVGRNGLCPLPSFRRVTPCGAPTLTLEVISCR
jgi:hypothetical protein